MNFVPCLHDVYTFAQPILFMQGYCQKSSNPRAGLRFKATRRVRGVQTRRTDLPKQRRGIKGVSLAGVGSTHTSHDGEIPPATFQRQHCDELRVLPAGSVVIIGTSAVTQFSAAIQFALQFLEVGSHCSLMKAVHLPWSVCARLRIYAKSLGGRVSPDCSSCANHVPHGFSVAPVANFEASYVQGVKKEDPFPSEKPIKPELAAFKAVEPEFDPFCDLGIRTNLQSVDCELHPSECPEKGHPCHHTYDKKVDEANFWELTQRDIDRAYSEGLADVAEKQLEREHAEVERTFPMDQFRGPDCRGPCGCFWLQVPMPLQPTKQQKKLLVSPKLSQRRLW